MNIKLENSFDREIETFKTKVIIAQYFVHVAFGKQNEK